MREQIIEEGTFEVPPHLLDPSKQIGICWLDPPGALLQIHPVRATTEMAQWVATEGLRLLLQRFPDEHALTVVLDMRAMVGRSALARAVILHAAEHAAGRVARVVLLPSVHMGPTYSAIIETAAVALRLIGYRVDVERDLRGAMEKYGLRVRDRGVRGGRSELRS